MAKGWYKKKQDLTDEVTSCFLMKMLLVADGTDREPAVTVDVAPGDMAGTAVHGQREVRVARTEGRRPVEAEGTHIPEAGVGPVASGGKEYAVSVAGGNQPPVHSVLRCQGPSAILP